MDKVLLFGGSGLVGRSIAHALGAANVLCTYRNHPIAEGVFYDAATTDPDAFLDTFGQNVSHAIILFGVVTPDACARDPVGSRNINVVCTCNLVMALRRRGISVVYTSTESVFGGDCGNYAEQDEPHPVLEYGRQKIAAENIVRDSDDLHLIVRLGRVVGTEPGDGTLFTGWLERIARGSSLRCAFDHTFSPIHLEDVGTTVLALMHRECSGTYHVCGPDAWTRLEMLRCLLEHWRESGGNWRGEIEVVRLQDFPVLEKRPENVSMCPAKVVADTDVKLRGIKDCCEETTRKWWQHHG